MTNNDITKTDEQDFPADLYPVETDLFSSVEWFSIAVFGFSCTLLGTISFSTLAVVRNRTGRHFRIWCQ